MEKKIINVGTIKGRHDMPVDAYLFNTDIKNPMDIRTIELNTALKVADVLAYYNIDTDNHKDVEIHLYVTGLTTVTIAALNAFKSLHFDVVVYHYNRDTNDYVAQRVL